MASNSWRPLYQSKEEVHSFVRNHHILMATQALDADSLGASTFAEGNLVAKDNSGSNDSGTLQFRRPGICGYAGSRLLGRTVFCHGDR